MASADHMDGHITSRRDDLIQLLYFSIYLLNGYLPWESLDQGKDKNKLRKAIINMKNTSTLKSLCCEDAKILRKFA